MAAQDRYRVRCDGGARSAGYNGGHWNIGIWLALAGRREPGELDR